ncbi:MAG: hypothetical protein K2I79_00480, partial [Clostridia bacterium]|nr:hypothetical protein [Clostridia bacterium]
LGSGSNANSSSYVSGNAMITNLMIEKSDAATHSSTSSATNVATASLKSGGTTNEFASNGYFSVIDASNTNSTYKDVIKDNDLGDFEYSDSNEWHIMPLPKSWSASSTTRLTDKFGTANSYAYGGTLNLNSAVQRKWFSDEIGNVSSYLKNALADNAYTSIYETAGQLSGLTLKDNPTVLALYANRLNKFGMSSSSVSLSANSYYVISAWVFADRNTRVSVSLTTGSDNAEFGFIDVTNSANGWQQYRIFVETGVTSINATLSLTLGSVNADDQVSSNSYAALFTGATYQSITEDDYNSFVSNAKANGTSVSWLVDGMDNINESEDTLASNQSWSGSLIDSDASTDDVDAGVFDRNIHSWDTLLDLDVDGADQALLEAVFNASVNDANINNGTLTAIGNRVMVIYNHDDVVDDDGKLNGGAYQMTSGSITLTKGSYYKISVWVLTYKIGKDNSAIVSLKIGNNSYTFGNAAGDDNSELDNLRRINTSTYSDDGTETVGTWRELSF